MDSEPMTLGSPKQSASYVSDKGTPQSSFLPSYLIGSNPSTPTAARSLQAAVSPKNFGIKSDAQARD